MFLTPAQLLGTKFVTSSSTSRLINPVTTGRRTLKAAAAFRTELSLRALCLQLLVLAPADLLSIFGLG